jgi:hypothetical protein
MELYSSAFWECRITSQLYYKPLRSHRKESALRYRILMEPDLSETRGSSNLQWLQTLWDTRETCDHMKRIKPYRTMEVRKVGVFDLLARGTRTSLTEISSCAQEIIRIMASWREHWLKRGVRALKPEYTCKEVTSSSRPSSSKRWLRDCWQRLKWPSSGSLIFITRKRASSCSPQGTVLHDRVALLNIGGLHALHMLLGQQAHLEDLIGFCLFT